MFQSSSSHSRYGNRLQRYRRQNFFKIFSILFSGSIIILNLSFLNASRDNDEVKFSYTKDPNRPNDFSNALENSDCLLINQKEKIYHNDLYFICLCVEKSIYGEELSSLLVDLLSNLETTFFCRILQGVINVTYEEKYYFWEKIPKVLQNAFTNVEKPPISSENVKSDFFCVDMMEFHTSNKETCFGKHSLDEYIGNIRKHILEKRTKKPGNSAKRTSGSV